LGVAVTAVAAFVALVGSLIYLGMRQRPMLEIPPKRWEKPSPLPRWLGRLRVAGLIAFLTSMVLFLLMEWLGFRLAGRILAGIGWSFYFVSLFIRITVLVRLALKRRETQAEERLSPSTPDREPS
jgi:hypothetical protein